MSSRFNDLDRTKGSTKSSASSSKRRRDEDTFNSWESSRKHSASGSAQNPPENYQRSKMKIHQERDYDSDEMDMEAPPPPIISNVNDKATAAWDEGDEVDSDDCSKEPSKTIDWDDIFEDDSDDVFTELFTEMRGSSNTDRDEVVSNASMVPGIVVDKIYNTSRNQNDALRHKDTFAKIPVIGEHKSFTNSVRNSIPNKAEGFQSKSTAAANHIQAARIPVIGQDIYISNSKTNTNFGLQSSSRVVDNTTYASIPVIGNDIRPTNSSSHANVSQSNAQSHAANISTYNEKKPTLQGNLNALQARFWFKKCLDAGYSIKEANELCKDAPVNLKIVCAYGRHLKNEHFEIFRDAIKDYAIDTNANIKTELMDIFREAPGIKVICFKNLANWLKSNFHGIRKKCELNIIIVEEADSANEVAPKDESKATHTIRGNFPNSEAYTEPKILSLIKIQNELNTSQWKLLKKEDNDTVFVFQIDYSSWQKLLKINCSIAYGFGQVKLELLEIAQKQNDELAKNVKATKPPSAECSYFIKGKFPQSETYTNAKILGLIKAQNDLDVSLWTALDANDKDSIYSFKIDEASWHKLQQMKGLINYRLGKVTLELNKTNNSSNVDTNQTKAANQLVNSKQQFFRVCGHFSNSQSYPNKRILDIIEAHNDLKTSLWKIVARKGENFSFRIDDSSWKTLLKSNGLICYGDNKLKLKMLGPDNSKESNQPSTESNEGGATKQTDKIPKGETSTYIVEGIFLNSLLYPNNKILNLIASHNDLKTTSWKTVARKGETVSFKIDEISWQTLLKTNGSIRYCDAKMQLEMLSTVNSSDDVDPTTTNTNVVPVEDEIVKPTQSGASTYIIEGVFAKSQSYPNNKILNQIEADNKKLKASLWKILARNNETLTFKIDESSWQQLLNYNSLIHFCDKQIELKRTNSEKSYKTSNQVLGSTNKAGKAKEKIKFPKSESSTYLVEGEKISKESIQMASTTKKKITAKEPIKFPKKESPTHSDEGVTTKKAKEPIKFPERESPTKLVEGVIPKSDQISKESIQVAKSIKKVITSKEPIKLPVNERLTYLVEGVFAKSEQYTNNKILELLTTHNLKATLWKIVERQGEHFTFEIGRKSFKQLLFTNGVVQYVGGQVQLKRILTDTTDKQSKQAASKTNIVCDTKETVKLPLKESSSYIIEGIFPNSKSYKQVLSLIKVENELNIYLWKLVENNVNKSKFSFEIDEYSWKRLLENDGILNYRSDKIKLEMTKKTVFVKPQAEEIRNDAKEKFIINSNQSIHLVRGNFPESQNNDASEILLIIQVQNNMDTALWKVLPKTTTDSVYTFEVDKSSLNKLAFLNGRISYRFGHVQLESLKTTNCDQEIERVIGNGKRKLSNEIISTSSATYIVRGSFLRSNIYSSDKVLSIIKDQNDLDITWWLAIPKTKDDSYFSFIVDESSWQKLLTLDGLISYSCGKMKLDMMESDCCRKCSTSSCAYLVSGNFLTSRICSSDQVLDLIKDRNDFDVSLWQPLPKTEGDPIFAFEVDENSWHTILKLNGLICYKFGKMKLELLYNDLPLDTISNNKTHEHYYYSSIFLVRGNFLHSLGYSSTNILDIIAMRNHIDVSLWRPLPKAPDDPIFYFEVDKSSWQRLMETNGIIAYTYGNMKLELICKKTHKVWGNFLYSRGFTSEYVLSLIKAQNDIDVSLWKPLPKLRDDSVYFFEIDESSWDTLLQNNGVILYGNDQIILELFKPRNWKMRSNETRDNSTDSYFVQGYPSERFERCITNELPVRTYQHTPNSSFEERIQAKMVRSSRTIIHKRPYERPQTSAEMQRKDTILKELESVINHHKSKLEDLQSSISNRIEKMQSSSETFL